MVAYRAETAMANSLREHLSRPDEAHRLLPYLFTRKADLLPDPDAGTLTLNSSDERPARRATNCF
jgi:hypothetical protein